MSRDDVNGRADAPPAGSAAGLADALQDLLQHMDATMLSGRPVEARPVVARCYEQLRAYDASLRGEVAVWISPYVSDRAGLVDGLAGRDEAVLGALQYTDLDADMAASGWTRVGNASITLRAFSQTALLDEHVKALRAQQAEARARAQAVDTEFERQIQCLLAIDLKPVGGAS